jgi:hypothetical protein
MYQSYGAAPQRTNVQPYVNQIATGLLNEVTRLANSNSMRQHVYYLLSPNGGNNPPFQDILGATVDFVDWLINTQQVHPTTAIPRAIVEILAMFTATEALSNQQLLQGQSPEVIAELQGQAQNFVGLSQQINSYLAATQPQQPMYQPSNPGYGPPPGQGYPQGQGYPPGGGYQQGGVTGLRHAGFSASRSSASFPGQRPATSSTPAFDKQYGAQINPTATTPFRASNPAPAAPTNYTPTPSAVPTNYAAGSKAIQLPAAPDLAPDYVDPYRVLQSPGCTVKYTRVAGREWTSVFDPTTHVGVFNINSDRSVTDSYIKKSEAIGLDYEKHRCSQYFTAQVPADVDHAPDATLRDLALSQAMQTMTIKQLLADLKKRTATGPQPVTGSDITLPEYSVVLDKPIVCESATDFQNELLRYMTNNDIGHNVVALDDCTFHYEHIRYYKWVLSGTEAGLAKSLSTCRSWGEMRTRLLAMAGLPDSYFRALTTSVTDHVNELLHIGLGIPRDELNISSFCVDIPGLLDILKAEYSEADYAAFDKAFIQVRDSTLRVHSGESYISATGIKSDAETMNTALGYGISTNVTTLPLLSRDLSIAGMGADVGDAGIVHSSTMPKLYDLVADRMNSQPKHIRRTILVTADGAIINCHKALNGTAYLISRG